MDIETKTSQLNETPPKRTERNKKTRHKGTPKELAPRKKKPKKNTPEGFEWLRIKIKRKDKNFN